MNGILLLRGLQFGYMIVPCIASAAVGDEAIARIAGQPEKHWSLHEFPVAVDLDSGAAHFFKGRSVWGAFFFSDLPTWWQSSSRAIRSGLAVPCDGPFSPGVRGQMEVILPPFQGRQTMRAPGKLTATAALLVLAFFGCGGESTRLTLDEYVEMQQTMTDELQAMGQDLVVELVEVVDLDAGIISDPAGLQKVLEDAAERLRSFYDRLRALNPPEALEAAHSAFVVAAEDRVEQWEAVAAAALEYDSLEALEAATDARPGFIEACVGLEEAVADNGLVLGLGCD